MVSIRKGWVKISLRKRNIVKGTPRLLQLQYMIFSKVNEIKHDDKLNKRQSFPISLFRIPACLLFHDPMTFNEKIDIRKHSHPLSFQTKKKFHKPLQNSFLLAIILFSLSITPTPCVMRILIRRRKWQEQRQRRCRQWRHRYGLQHPLGMVVGLAMGLGCRLGNRKEPALME